MICGYIVLSTKWFDQDGEEIVKSFFVHCDKQNRIVFNTELRALWEKAVQPLYVNFYPDRLFYFEDLKSNPRRVHVYAEAYYQWYVNVQDYASGLLDSPPVVILKSTSVSFDLLTWRKGLPEYAKRCVRVYSTQEVNRALCTLQRWCRCIVINDTLGGKKTFDK
jgi:hypothetical protein